MSQPYDALLVLSFGGPECRDDVLPFLENVLRGKNVPRERMLEVAEHYYHFGGVSPINAQNRALIAALDKELSSHDISLPIYWGNRNWHPLLPDTLRQMRADGIQRSLVFFTSMFSCYSGCRQYREDIARARAELGPDAPQLDRLRFGFNHPEFIHAVADHVRVAMNQLDEEFRDACQLVFTAHSLPVAMARGCQYETQLREACRLVSETVEHSSWTLAYQSRSGPPSQPWLEPDICEHLRLLHESREAPAAVVVPIGFVSDHMEVLFDLDTEAMALCKEWGLKMVRANTPGTHPRFLAMIRGLVQERLSEIPERSVIGELGPNPDSCPTDCCPSGRPRPSVMGGGATSA
jgi:ferrochelatase